MNGFDYTIVEEAAKQLYIRALCDLPPDVRSALKRAYETETSTTAKEIFKAMLQTVDIADRKKTLICQDTGLPIYMVQIGSDFNWNGAEIKARLTEGIHPGVVSAQYGWWFPEKEPPEYGFRESNVNLLTGNIPCDPHTGSESLRSFLCRIYRV